MKLTKILKSKRGMAIENAVLFILIIFSLCSLMALMALTQHYQTKIDKIRLDQDIELEQIGEHFLAYLESGEDSFDSYLQEFYEGDMPDFYGKYDTDVYGCALVVKLQDSENVLRYFRAELANVFKEENGETKWVVKATYASLSYSEPEDALLEIDKIGDAFVKYCEEYNDDRNADGFKEYLQTNSVIPNVENTEYEFVISPDGTTLYVKKKTDGENKIMVLGVTISDDNVLKLVSWQYPN